MEECDNFQGLQASFDNTSFGGFTVAFLEALKNEYAKTLILTIPILSGLDPQSIGIEEVSHSLPKKQGEKRWTKGEKNNRKKEAEEIEKIRKNLYMVS